MARSRRLLNAEAILAAAILLLALQLRVGWPRLTEFKFSEARLEALALELTREGRLPPVGVPSSAGFDHSPISVYLYIPAFLLTSSPVPAIVYGGLVNVAAVVLAWRLARRWPGGGRAAALVTLALFAVSPWSVLFSRKIWQIAFVPLLSLAFVAIVVSALLHGRRWSLAWGLGLYAVLVQVHPSALSLVPALLLWFVLFWRQIRIRELLTGMSLGAASLLPFLIHQLQSGWPVFAAQRALPSAHWDLSGVRLAWETVSGLGIDALAGQSYSLLEWVPQLTRSFGLLGWLTAAASLFLCWRIAIGWRRSEPENRRIVRLDFVLLSWLIIPILFNLRHSLELHLHFFSLILPAAYLIIGRAVQHVVSGRGERLQLVLVGTGFSLIAAVQVVTLVLMGRFVATHPTSGGFGTPLGDYLQVADEALTIARKEQVVELLTVGDGDSPVVSEYPAIFDVLLRDRISVRFVDGESTALFPARRAMVLVSPGAGRATDWYREWPAREITHGYKTILLDGSWPEDRFELVQGARLFQNGVELQGVAWQRAAGDPSQLRIWLLWQILWQSEDDTHFFVQVLDTNGAVWAQQDGDGYPVSSRAKGDRIVSVFDISAGNSGILETSSVRVGQYLFPQIVNVPVVDQAGDPVGETVAVDLSERRP